MFATTPTLYYIHDPMCSWCWGFTPVWKAVQQKLQERYPETVKIQYILGGLAPDTDKIMPESMQVNIRDNWRKIQQEIPGIQFNYDFWTSCKPRRSTYPSCRSVIACGMQQQDLKDKMVVAIQQAYYLDAKNPSEEEVLIELAVDIGLDPEIFSDDLNSDTCNRLLEDDFLIRRKLGVHSFPSLVLVQRSEITNIPVDYNDSETILSTITHKLNLSGQG